MVNHAIKYVDWLTKAIRSKEVAHTSFDSDSAGAIYLLFCSEKCINSTRVLLRK